MPTPPSSSLSTGGLPPDPTGGKRALVLSGGGVTGLTYEIGALRALDDLLVGASVNDFDIFVGTSAGSIVGALLANGISPTPTSRRRRPGPSTSPTSASSPAACCACPAWPAR
jgi:hypothetical protein